MEDSKTYQVEDHVNKDCLREQCNITPSQSTMRIQPKDE